MDRRSSNTTPRLFAALAVVFLLGACVGREQRVGIKADGTRETLSEKLVLPMLASDAFALPAGYESVETKRWFLYGLLRESIEYSRPAGRSSEPMP